MTQKEALKVVKRERDYQDETYNPSDEMQGGLLRYERDSEATPHIALIETYAAKAKAAWVNTGENFQALQAIAKIGAIAVRALERVGGNELILKEGLR